MAMHKICIRSAAQQTDISLMEFMLFLAEIVAESKNLIRFIATWIYVFRVAFDSDEEDERKKDNW